MNLKRLTNNGPYIQEFERLLQDYLGVKHCIAVCNGTVALEIAVKALGLAGEVIMPSMTFIATAHALQWQGVTPVFCDIDPVTLCMDPARVEKHITPRTSGIIGVHIYGRPCNTDSLARIAERNNLKVLYDAAHAFGCTHKGWRIGRFGNAEIFSFHATKLLSSFEGGAITTNDDRLAEKLRLMRNFGFKGFDNVIYIGTNGKMSEISAAMGITSLESLEESITTNRINYECYRREIASIPGIDLMTFDETEECNYQYIVTRVNESVARVSRDRLVKILHAENVIARRYFYPGCHHMEPYRSLFPHAGLLLPVTEKVSREILVLPTGTAVGEAEIGRICSILRLCAKHAEEIKDT